MKFIFLVAAICLLSVGISQTAEAQSIPADSLYLGQALPGKKPVVFRLPVAKNFFAAERIAITNDGREIIYQELDGYSELDGKPHTIRMKRLVFSGGRWDEPSVLFEGVFCPVLLGGEDTLLYQRGLKEAFASVREGAGWSAPRRFLAGLKIANYYQTTKNGTRYISAVPPKSIGGIDRCLLNISGGDTVVTSLGVPINTPGHDLDFFVARDESYMFVATDHGLCISYHKPDGSWTNPKNLGRAINFGMNEWGPYVSRDNKYLFYTTGTKPDYSDTYIYWFRVSELIDGLKHTNFSPYVKNKPSGQNGTVGASFKYVLPETTFFDDDGNNTLTFSSTLDDGRALPSWLRFDPRTSTFSGMPSEPDSYMIAVRATDNAGEFVDCVFELVIGAPAR